MRAWRLRIFSTYEYPVGSTHRAQSRKMGVTKSAALGFSRTTDNFRSVEWCETVVQWAPAAVAAAHPKLTGKVLAGAPHVPAARRSSGQARLKS